jgi:putative membrane protein
MMWWWPGGGTTGWGWVAMTISMALFWGVLVLGGIWLARALNRPGASSGDRSSTPEQVLAERFARGEIDEEEYRGRLETLHRSGYANRP